MKKSILMALFIFAFVGGCATLNQKMMYKHDLNNPCTCDYDTVECQNWKTKYPNEYLEYKNRMEIYRSDSVKAEMLRCE